MIVIKSYVSCLFQVSTISVASSPSLALEVRATYVKIETTAAFFLTSENQSS
jgi:hypothetical protein